MEISLKWKHQSNGNVTKMEVFLNGNVTKTEMLLKMEMSLKWKFH